MSPVTTPLEPATAAAPTSRERSLWFWFAISSLAITVMAVGPYLTESLAELADRDSGVAANYVDRPAFFQTMLYLHAGFAGIALVLSPLQLAGRLRATHPRVHRTIGRVVLVSIAVAGVAGAVLSLVNEAGPIGTVGFGALALLWLACAAMALRRIRVRDVAGHRRWAVRTFALTYAGVTLRLQTLVLVAAQVALGVDGDAAFDRAYYVVTLSSWIPNLVVAEWYLRRTSRAASPARRSAG
jgi:uncharacterized membrane protein